MQSKVSWLTFLSSLMPTLNRMVARQGATVPSSFFHPKFTRIAPPKQGEKNYDEKARGSLLYEFNRVQREQRKGTCGPTAASEWLKKHRPKVALHLSILVGTSALFVFVSVLRDFFADQVISTVKTVENCYF